MHFFESSLEDTDATLKIESIEMPSSTKMITFRNASNKLTQEEIQTLATESIPEKELIGCCKNRKVVNTKVKIKIMNLRWLMNRRKGFMDFVPILNTYNKDNLYKTDFMKSLTSEFWMDYLKRIIYQTLIPWIFFTILSVIYFAHALNEEFKDENSD